MLQVETHIMENTSPTDRLTWGLWGTQQQQRGLAGFLIQEDLACGLSLYWCRRQLVLGLLPACGPCDLLGVLNYTRLQFPSL